MTELIYLGQRQIVEPFLSSLPTDYVENNVDNDYLYDMTSGQAYCLYLSHFLSMWNSRMYEFGAVSLPCNRLFSLDRS